MYKTILEIYTNIGTRFFRTDQELTEKIEHKVCNPVKNKAEMKMRFINFFLTPVAQTYQNESEPIFYYAKSKKYSLKILKIAVLHPPD